ncbi:MAG: DUF397 domain-containing protein [Actinophytocola sp.]|uniref:DUF397 domain-containing protein n=1 Tax=Actinophytocola sp. TaxID=1872138 RepID=UPI003D6B5A5E
MADRPVSWRVSSYSGQGGSCVEIRNDLCAVRDSKDRDEAVLRTSGLPDLIKVVRSRY